MSLFKRKLANSLEIMREILDFEIVRFGEMQIWVARLKRNCWGFRRDCHFEAWQHCGGGF